MLCATVLSKKYVRNFGFLKGSILQFPTEPQMSNIPPVTVGIGIAYLWTEPPTILNYENSFLLFDILKLWTVLRKSVMKTKTCTWIHQQAVVTFTIHVMRLSLRTFQFGFFWHTRTHARAHTHRQGHHCIGQFASLFT